jgi:hypothetical protein
MSTVTTSPEPKADWSARLVESKVEADLTEAAREAGAPRPQLVAKVFKTNAKVVEDGGKLTTVVSIDGKDLPLKDAIQHAKKDHANLFVTDVADVPVQVKPDPTTGRLSRQQIELLSQREYLEVRSKNPEWLGLSRRYVRGH